MSTLNLNLSNDLRERLQSRAAEAGYATVEEYAEAVLRFSAEEQFVDDDVEELLMQRLDDPRPGIEFNQQFKQQF